LFFPQHKKHSSDPEEQKLAAAKAFLEQHLKATATGDAAAGGSSAAALAAAAAAAGGGGLGRLKGSSGKKSREKEKPAGQLPEDVMPISMDDYFERSSEFTAWLQETRHQYFNGAWIQEGWGSVVEVHETQIQQQGKHLLQQQHAAGAGRYLSCGAWPGECISLLPVHLTCML
jgi:hypothetical protein